MDDKSKKKSAKIEHLERLLETARSNPSRYEGFGIQVFVDSCPSAFDEACNVHLCVDGAKRPYFRVIFDGEEHGADYTPEELLKSIDRYIPESDREFIEEFSEVQS